MLVFQNIKHKSVSFDVNHFMTICQNVWTNELLSVGGSLWRQTGIIVGKIKTQNCQNNCETYQASLDHTYRIQQVQMNFPLQILDWLWILCKGFKFGRKFWIYQQKGWTRLGLQCQTLASYLYLTNSVGYFIRRNKGNSFETNFVYKKNFG